MKTEEKNYLTPKELEKKLKLSHYTASKLIHTKGFPMIKIGRNIRIDEEALGEFLKSYMGQTINL